jgi:LysM repeat protein
MTLPGIKVEITIKDNETGKSLTIPVLPTIGEIAYDDGDQKPITVDILDLGTVAIPAGVELDSIGWESFFPARHDPSYCAVGPSLLKTPLSYRNQFSSWKDNGTSLQVIIAAFGLNKTMFLQSFKPKLRGAEGDIYYTVNFTEHIKLAPKKVKPDGTPVSTGQTADDRPAPATAADASNTYTVVNGDTLTLIGKKVPKPWKTIYEDNKAVIGTNPNLIKPGQVYKL